MTSRIAFLSGLLIACSSKRAGGGVAQVRDTAEEAARDTAPPVDTDGGHDSGDAPPGPCASWGGSEAAGQVEDRALEEISGLVVSRQNPGVIWVLEDSGADPVLTALDLSGATLGTLALTGVDNRDWEDLALGPCGERTCLWVGEFGDNGASRDEVALIWVEEPLLEGATGFSLSAPASAQAYAYPEGPQNVEALVVDPGGQPYVLTKRLDGRTRVYRVPVAGSGSTMAELIGTVVAGPASGLATAVTAADLWPDGSRLIVRGYLSTYELDLGSAGMAAAPTASATQVNTAVEIQGEAIAYDPAGRAIWHVSEGVQPILYRIACED